MWAWGGAARGVWAESFSSLLWGGQQGSLPSPCCSENQQSRGRAGAQAPVRREGCQTYFTRPGCVLYLLLRSTNPGISRNWPLFIDWPLKASLSSVYMEDICRLLGDYCQIFWAGHSLPRTWPTVGPFPGGPKTSKPHSRFRPNKSTIWSCIQGQHTQRTD